MRMLINILLFFCINAYSQNDSVSRDRYFDSLKSSMEKKGIFFSIEDANKVNSDSVFSLILGNQGLKKFPLDILNYKNLKILNFIDYNVSELYLNSPWLLNEKEKKEYLNIFKKNPHVNRGEGIYPTPNKTKIRNVPIEISRLKNLKFLYLNNKIYRKQNAKLKILLPNSELIKG